MFLEDNEAWYQAVTDRCENIVAFLVRYDTELRTWQNVLDRPDSLQPDLPRRVTRAKWDVILVDGPDGASDAAPGRMQSIFAASQLAAPSCDIYVHDGDRIVESTYCDTYFGRERLVRQVGRLRHYRMSNVSLTGGR